MAIVLSNSYAMRRWPPVHARRDLRFASGRWRDCSSLGRATVVDPNRFLEKLFSEPGVESNRESSARAIAAVPMRRIATRLEFAVRPGPRPVLLRVFVRSPGIDGQCGLRSWKEMSKWYRAAGLIEAPAWAGLQHDEKSCPSALPKLGPVR